MVTEVRKKFNENFKQETYEAYLKYLWDKYDYEIEFRIAETPVFIPKYLKERILEGGEQIIDVITKPDFIERTNRAIPEGLAVPNETAHPNFLAIDWAICQEEDGSFTPRLIELQGFPSLFGFQEVISQAALKFWNIPEGFEYLFSGLTSEGYVNLLKKTICGNHSAENVILLEIEPEKQKTKVDFYATAELIGIKYICLSEVWAEGDLLFYFNEGKKTQVKRIYNRVIFDELSQRTDFTPGFDLTKPYQVEWAGHPAWFFRISKFILPMLDSQYVPKTSYLNELKEVPADLENYVLKPLFSFAGTGVVFDVKPEDIAAVTEPENFILMKKVKYADAIESPDGPVKVEVRMLYLWPDGDAKPTLSTSLIRLSKGVMMGVKFNKNKTWVGGSLAFFQK